MKFLIITMASLTILGLSANAQARGKCVDGKMIEGESDTGIACFITRSGKTIRLFRTQGSSQNVKHVDAEEQEACDDGSIMRVTPVETSCISGEDLKISREVPGQIIRVSDLPKATGGITVFAGGRRRSQ